MTEQKDKRLLTPEKILDLIRQVWEKYPGLRLCQLIGNCFPWGDNYYKEDAELVEQLEKYYHTKAKLAQVDRQNIVCPFCSEDGFDKPGLKDHLNVYCEIYQNVEVLR